MNEKTEKYEEKKKEKSKRPTWPFRVDPLRGSRLASRPVGCLVVKRS